MTNTIREEGGAHSAGLLELAARVESLQGPDREVDAEIGRAIGYKVLYDATDPSDRIPYYQPDPELSWRALPLYSFSLDAAMTLVPEGMACGFDGPASFGRSDRSGQGWFGTCGSVPRHGFIACVMAATPALALTAGCLRARAAIAKARPAPETMLAQGEE